MSTRQIKNENESAVAAAGTTGGLVGLALRLLRPLNALRIWASGYWLRSVIVASAILALIALTMGGWAYLASVALRSGVGSLESALQALDEGRHEEARTAVNQLLRQRLLARKDYGVPLYVLGAAKIKDAEEQPAADRRRLEFLVASRYLKEARAHDLPAERVHEALYLWGKSLLESGQFEEGVSALEELLATDLPPSNPLRPSALQLLAESYLLKPLSLPDKALEHYSTLLTETQLSDENRARALLNKAECLARLARFEEAEEAVAGMPSGHCQAEAALMRGKLTLDKLEDTSQHLDEPDRRATAATAAESLEEVKKLLEQAASLDPQKARLTRYARYQLARVRELQGKTESATKEYGRVRQLYGESLEGLAAALAEADLLRKRGDVEASALAYRRVLKSFADMPVYRSTVLPLPQVRARLMAALHDLLEQQHFSTALALIEDFPPLFSRTAQLELKAGTLEQWGKLLLSQANGAATKDEKNISSGLQRLRAAGAAYEQLAEQRFSTRSYTTDLWKSAENYFKGHSFSRTISLLNKYLDYEPELRSAEALLRIGQSHLALGQIPQSVAVLEECIEFYPLDGLSCQARIDCAKAYWYLGKTDRAEQLLRENIVGSSLTPASREWKDSLFELGMLLHEQGRYDDAIGTLEEAIERYPQDSQRLLAQYLIGESYRHVGKQQLDRAQQTRIASEREKQMQAAKEQLATALRHFEEVQRAITLKTHDIHNDPLLGSMLRNCYMLQGTVLFDLGECDSEARERRYREAIEAYSNVASLYPDNPFVLETFVQIANCWRRLERNDNARGALQQAQIVLDRLPADSDFTTTTTRTRDEWRVLLAELNRW